MSYTRGNDELIPLEAVLAKIPAVPLRSPVVEEIPLDWAFGRVLAESLMDSGVRRGGASLRRGMRLRARHLGAAAAAGRHELAVYRRPRVALVATEKEIYCTNRYVLSEHILALGAEVDDRGVATGDPEHAQELLCDAASASDLVVVTGGASAEAEDQKPAVLGACGPTRQWRTAITPGGAVTVGMVGTTPALALAGTAADAVVSLLLIGRPLVLAVAGAEASPPPRFKVAVAHEIRRDPRRRQFLGGRLLRSPDGRLLVDSCGTGRDDPVRSMSCADGLIDVPAGDGTSNAACLMDFIPWEAFG